MLYYSQIFIYFVAGIGKKQAIVTKDELEKDQEQEMQNPTLNRSVSLSTGVIIKPISSGNILPEVRTIPLSYCFAVKIDLSEVT